MPAKILAEQNLLPENQFETHSERQDNGQAIGPPYFLKENGCGFFRVIFRGFFKIIFDFLN